MVSRSFPVVKLRNRVMSQKLRSPAMYMRGRLNSKKQKTQKTLRRGDSEAAERMIANSRAALLLQV